MGDELDTAEAAGPAAPAPVGVVTRTATIVAGLALFLALIYAFTSYVSSDRAATATDRDCGSPVAPADTWDDCIDRRDDGWRAAVVAATATVIAGAVALVSLSARRRPPAEPDPSVRGARWAGWTVAALAVLAFAWPVSADSDPGVPGDRSCKTLVTGLPASWHPTDEFGNFDGACLDAYQDRLVRVLWVAALAAALLVGVWAWRRAVDVQAAVWAGVAATLVVWAVLLVGLTVVANVTTAARGGA